MCEVAPPIVVGVSYELGSNEPERVILPLKFLDVYQQIFMLLNIIFYVVTIFVNFVVLLRSIIFILYDGYKHIYPNELLH